MPESNNRIEPLHKRNRFVTGGIGVVASSVIIFGGTKTDRCLSEYFEYSQTESIDEVVREAADVCVEPQFSVHDQYFAGLSEGIGADGSISPTYSQAELVLDIGTSKGISLAVFTVSLYSTLRNLRREDFRDFAVSAGLVKEPRDELTYDQVEDN